MITLHGIYDHGKIKILDNDLPDICSRIEIWLKEPFLAKKVPDVRTIRKFKGTAVFKKMTRKGEWYKQ